MGLNEGRTDVGIPARPFRRGAVVVYGALTMIVFVGICSLAVDYGRAQMVKTELRRTADATAHDYLTLYLLYGQSYADANGPQSYNSGNNPVCSGTSAAPTMSVQWGYWDATHRSFSTTNNGGTTAVKATASCTAANGNAVPLVFGSMFGLRTVDVAASAVSALTGGGQSTDVNVASTSNPYLAGMPPGTTTVWGDTTGSNGATQVAAIPVTPGTYLTFTNVSGTTSVVPGTMPYVSGAGSQSGSGTATHHGQNWDGSILSASTENGIADAVMPESTLMGLFLDDNAPNATAAPATVDWTQASMKDQASYNSIQLKQPFAIGNGQTSGGTVQKFLVPPGATRFYLGIWDGVSYNNNGGSLTVTVSVARSVQTVQ